jgi:AbrB family looped-hinge helix DNA binding protein
MRSAINLNAKTAVSSKGQVVIPRVFREMLGLHNGSELVFEMQQNGTLAMKPIRRSIDMFFGRCKRKGEPALSITGMDEAIARAVIQNDDAD